MNSNSKVVLLGLAVLFATAALLVALRSGRTPPQISARLLGMTNGVVGLTNGSWTVYVVTNHTTTSFGYAGAKIELKGDRGWILDPALTPTEVGWLAPPTPGMA
jgi:hypothetical protein